MNSKYLYVGLFFTILFMGCATDDSGSGGDIQNPSAPSNLTATNITQTSVQLSWDAATDDTGIANYQVTEEISGNVISVGGSTTSREISGLAAATAYRYHVTALDAAGNESAQSNTVEITTAATPLEFKQLLSEMEIYAGDLGDLTPGQGVQLYEINSTLFTDYASKQRLLKLPDGAPLTYTDGNLSPNFPNNTIIAKTFYYNIDDRDPSLGKIIIETRILLKHEEGWQVGNYIWNSAQTDATYRETGSTEFISYIDMNGDTQNIDYIIPAQADCFTCHNLNDDPIPIGMKMRNLNFVPSYTNQNQLEYFIDNDILSALIDISQISVLPDWMDDVNYSLEERARAYMDINCAHCHSPGGSTPPAFDMDFRYETPFNDTGIYVNRGEIEARFSSTVPLYRMPLLGRTVVHEEALVVLSDYLDSL